ncbi:MAG: MFS transporter [Pseudomonadota bacterium]
MPDNANTASASSTSPLERPQLWRQKAFWIGVLYFSQGFPLGVFYEILPVYFRAQGVNLGDIGFLSLLGLGWTLKYLWAPIVGHLRGFRRWMFVVDLAMAALLSPLVFSLGFGPWVWMMIGLFVVMSATNDIAIDAYTIELVNKQELGIANGLRVAFYRAGMIVAGFALAMQNLIGWSGVYACTCALLILCAFACRLAPAEQPLERPPTLGLREELFTVVRTPPAMASVIAMLLGTAWIVNKTVKFADGIAGFWWYALGASALIWFALTLLASQRSAAQAADKDGAQPIDQGLMFGAIIGMLRRPGMVVVLIFIVTFKLADTTMGFIVKPFWLDVGFSPAQIGLVSVNIGLALSIAGGLIGGLITDRIGVFHALWTLGLTQMVSNLGYWGVSLALPLAPETPPDLFAQTIMYSASAVESFTQGLGTGAFLAFLMSIVNKRRSAAEYALLSSMFIFGRSVAGWVGGNLSEVIGYQDTFLLTFLAGIPAYLLLPWVYRLLKWTETQPEFVQGEEDEAQKA